MSWKTETFGSLLTESRIPCENPDIEKRIRVKLNVQGVEKRPVGAEKEGATKQFIRKAGQFIYGKQNFHKGAFGVIPAELDGFETSADIPSFDVREDCLPEWIYYFFKAGNRYLELTEYARGVGSQRIHLNQLQDLEIPLPPIDVQRKIIAELEIIEKDEISTELNHQLNLVKQLRQAFLREAMQGKLVPQDPNDEPASELLKRIKAEKEDLIKQGKIKKQKPLPPISEEEIQFEIPENWVWCRLGDCIISASDGPHFSPKYSKSGIPFISTRNISPSGINFDSAKYISREYHEEISLKCKPEKGDLLYTKGGTTGIATVNNYDFEFNVWVHVAVLKMTNHIDSNYLKYCLNSPHCYKQSQGLTRGISNQDLGLSRMVTISLSLPPLSEQQHIVAMLDELMQYCDKLEASIKNSQKQNEMLLQQVLREALEPKVNLEVDN